MHYEEIYEHDIEHVRIITLLSDIMTWTLLSQLTIPDWYTTNFSLDQKKLKSLTHHATSLK